VQSTFIGNLLGGFGNHMDYPVAEVSEALARS
jgi:hypothetical protein